MRNILRDYLTDLRDRQSVSIALAKGNASRQRRRIDLRHPASWEFSGFSQNGEDGIIEILRSHLRHSNRSCIEIGSADGLQNNTSWLLAVEQYSGIMIDGNRRMLATGWRLFSAISIGNQFRSTFVNKDNVHELMQMSLHRDPDVFSLDIDGNDYHIAKAVLESGLRPKIFVVEYNSAYGSERSITIAYQPEFTLQNHSTQLYYGASLQAWRKLFEDMGYQFVTVEQNGVNAFFVDPSQMDEDFLSKVEPLLWAENRFQNTKFRISCEDQFALIADQAFMEV